MHRILPKITTTYIYTTTTTQCKLQNALISIHGAREQLRQRENKKEMLERCTKSKSRQNFEVEVIREVIASSFDIWCKRNRCA